MIIVIYSCPGSIVHPGRPRQHFTQYQYTYSIYCFYRYSTLAYIYINFMLFFSFEYVFPPKKKCCKDAQRCCHYSSSNVSDMYKFPMEIFLRYIAINSKTYNFIRNILPMLNQCSCMLRLYQHKICFQLLCRLSTIIQMELLLNIYVINKKIYFTTIYKLFVGVFLQIYSNTLLSII